MAELKSSKDKLNQATKSLNPESANDSNDNKAIVSLLKKQGSILSKIQESLNNQDDKNDEETMKGYMKQSVGYLTSIKSQVTSITGTVSALKSVVSPISTQLDTTISLLGNIKTSLIQITGVLSAFRADYIMSNNGVTPRGEAFINKQLLTNDLRELAAIKSKALAQQMQTMRSASKFADLMSNAVRSKVGNTKMSKGNEGEGIFSRILGKLDPEIAETLGALTPLAAMFGIDDSNIKTLLGTTFKSKKKTLVDPLNEFIGGILNSDDASKGSDIKKLLAGKFRDLTGFGEDTKTLDREKDPNLVMSALAPFADDIKQMVDFEYKALSKRPNKIPIYAKPVWVVNSKYQKNGLTDKKNAKSVKNLEGDDGIRETQMMVEKLADYLAGNNTNKRDKIGKELGSFNEYTGEMEGQLFDQYIKSQGLENASYNTKFNNVKNLNNQVKENKRQNLGVVKETYRDNNGNLQQRDVNTIANTLTNVDLKGSESDIFNLVNGLSGVARGFKDGGAMGALFSALPMLIDGSAKNLVSSSSRKEIFGNIKTAGSTLKSNIKRDIAANKESKKSIDIPNYFAIIFAEEAKKIIGISAEDSMTPAFQDLIRVVTGSLNFQNIDTLSESLEKAKTKLIDDIEKLYPGLSNDILSIVVDCGERAFNEINSKDAKKKTGSSFAKKIIGLFKKSSQGNHHSGRKAKKKRKKAKGKKSSSVIQDYGPGIVEDTDTVLPAVKVKDEQNTETDEASIIAGISANMAGMAKIAANMNEDLINASNGETITGKHKNRFNPFASLKNIFSKTAASKTKSGGKAVKMITDSEKNTDISKDIKTDKGKIVHGEKRKRFSDIFGNKDENENNEEEKEKTIGEELFDKGKQKLFGKIRGSKLFKESKHLKEGLERVKNGIGNKTKSVRNKITGGIKKAAVGVGKVALKGVKSGGKAALKGIKLGAKGIEKSSKLGGKLIGGARKGFSFLNNKRKDRKAKKAGKTGIIGKAGNLANKIGKKLGGETNAEKREREKTEALKKQLESEEKAAQDAADERVKGEKQRQDDLNRSTEKIAKQSEDAEKKIADDKTDAAKAEIKSESDTNKAINKAKKSNDNAIEKTRMNAEKNEDRLEDAATNTEIATETSSTTFGSIIKNVGSGIGSVISSLSSSPFTLAAGIALAGGAAVKIFKMVKKAVKSAKEGKDPDSGDATKIMDDANKSAGKETKKAEKKKKENDKKEKEKKEKEEKKKDKKKKEKSKRRKHEKVYIDDDGTVKKVDDNETISEIEDNGNETGEALNVKTKEGKKQLIIRCIKKELKLVKGKPKSSLTQKSEKEIDKNRNDIMNSSAEASDKNKQNEDVKKSGLGGKIDKIKSNSKMAKLMRFMLISSSPLLFLGSKLRKKVDQTFKSSFGSMLMNAPEKASSILFNMSPAGTALSLAKSGIKGLSSIASKGTNAISSFFSSLFKKSKNDKENTKNTSTNLADGSYSENASIAYSQYKQRLANNDFMSSFNKSLGINSDMEVQTDSNGNQLTTSQIVDLERKNSAVQLLVAGSSGQNLSNSVSPSTSSISVDKGILASDFFLKTLANSSISSHIYRDNGEFHGGTDFAASVGTPVYSPVSGTVISTANEMRVVTEADGKSANGGMGNFVILRDKSGNYWRFMHMQSAPLVKKGDVINAGTQIGLVGNTGESYGSHLHVDLSPLDTTGGKNNQMMDIEKFILTGKGRKKKLWERQISPDVTAYGRNTNHIYQRDFENYGYNTSKDSSLQTLGDSGCGPASAAVVKSIFGKGRKNKQQRKYGKGYSVNSSTFVGNSVEEKLWRFMIANGCSKEWTAGIMGNIKQESGFNPFVMEGGAESKTVPMSSGGYGLIQWTGSDYQASADKCCKMLTNNAYGLNSMEGQFVLILATAIASEEVISFGDQMCSYAAQCLKDAGGLNYANSLSVRDATILWHNKVERSADPSPDQRIAYAEEIYSKFSKGDFSGGTSINMLGNSSSSTASVSGSMGTVSMQLDSYVDGSVLEKYLTKKSKSTEETEETNKSNNNSSKKGSILSNIKSSTNSNNTTTSSNVTPSNNATTLPSSNSNSVQQNTPVVSTLPSSNGGSNTIINNNNNYNNGGSIVICNNFDKNVTANLDDILSNFKKLNKTQTRALDVLKAISDLIKDDGSGEPMFLLDDSGLDLILKGL